MRWLRAWFDGFSPVFASLVVTVMAGLTLQLIFELGLLTGLIAGFLLATCERRIKGDFIAFWCFAMATSMIVIGDLTLDLLSGMLFPLGYWFGKYLLEIQQEKTASTF